MPRETNLEQVFAKLREGERVLALEGYYDNSKPPARLYVDLSYDAYVDLPEPVGWDLSGDPTVTSRVWIDAKERLELRYVDPGLAPPVAPDAAQLLSLKGGLEGAQPYLPLGIAARCWNKPSTSHTIGWCASE